MEKGRRPLTHALMSGILLSGALPPLPQAGAAADQAPRLVVLVHVDGFRADYLDRFASLLPRDGFTRLSEQGAVFENAAVTHTVATLAPGLASLSTGCLPGRAGIPTDLWFDRTTRLHRESVGDIQAAIVSSDEDSAKDELSPSSLERPTLGGLMQEQLGPESLVYGFSWHEMGALLLGGRQSDGSFWIDQFTGTWVSTTRLMTRLPSWLVEENEAGALERFRKTVWERSFDDETGELHASPDNDPDEPPFSGLPTFPYELPEFSTRRKLRQMAANMPVNDQLVLDGALTALRSTQLGRDHVADLLCIDFSSLGYGGRDYGPDSQEVMDIFLRLDRRLAELMANLDEIVGEGSWTLALTSGQGIARLPTKTGAPSLRSRDVLLPVELGLREHFAKTPITDLHAWTIGLGGSWLYLSQIAAERADASPAEVASIAAGLAGDIEGIAGALTVAQLRASKNPEHKRWVSDLHDERSGDVLLLLEPGVILRAGVGTHWGSHHGYDRRVPLMMFGRGIEPGQHDQPAEPLDVLPTIARLLGLEVPEDIDGQLLQAALTAE